MEKNKKLEELSNKISSLVDRDGEVGYELLESVEELNRIIQEEKIETRELFNYPELVSLRSITFSYSAPYDINNPIDKFFDETKFSKEMRQVIEELKTSTHNLTELEVRQISAFIKYGVLNRKDRNKFSDYVLQQVLHGNHAFSYEILEKSFINVIDEVLRTIDPGKYCQIVKDLTNQNGERLSGQKTDTGVKIDKAAVEKMYEFGDCEAIETAFHESVHIYQEVRLRTLAQTYDPVDIIKSCRGDFFETLDILKDSVLEKSAGRNYYYDNYFVSPQEKEANIKAKTMLIRYLDTLGLLTPYTMDQIKEEIDDELWQQQDSLRMFKGKERERDELVLENQGNLREVMKTFPMLHMVYTKDEVGNIREKTREEIKLEYLDLDNHGEEVTSVYKKLIESAKDEDKSVIRK